MRSEGVHDGRNILSKYMERKSAKSRGVLHQNSACQATKEDQKETPSEAGIPMLRESKVKHVRISSTSGSTKYTSINDWKIHNGSSDHDRTSTCLNITYKLSMMLEDTTDHWYQRLIPKGTNWTWWKRMVLHCKLRCQHIECRRDWLQHIRWNGID